MSMSLIDDLKNLAQEILLLNEDLELDELREKTLVLYEKLTILNYQNNQKEVSGKETIEILETKNSDSEEKMEEKVIEHSTPIAEKETNEISEKELPHKPPLEIEDLFIPTFDSIKEDMSQKEEFRDTITIEETEEFFERKRIEKIKKKVVKKKVEIESKQLSLHDKLLSNTIKVGLNDRIAFVNNLFNFNQADFNKVLSTLNDFENRKDAFDFINYTVKPKYNWSGKEDLVDRFFVIIERKYA